MSKVRSDLVGVVYVGDSESDRVVLKAGDEIPEGITLGDHLIEPEKDDEKPVRKSSK